MPNRRQRRADANPDAKHNTKPQGWPKQDGKPAAGWDKDNPILSDLDVRALGQIVADLLHGRKRIVMETLPRAFGQSTSKRVFKIEDTTNDTADQQQSDVTGDELRGSDGIQREAQESAVQASGTGHLGTTSEGLSQDDAQGQNGDEGSRQAEEGTIGTGEQESEDLSPWKSE